MLLQNELQFVESQMIELSKNHDLQSYANELKKSGNYKDFSLTFFDLNYKDYLKLRKKVTITLKPIK